MEHNRKIDIDSICFKIRTNESLPRNQKTWSKIGRDLGIHHDTAKKCFYRYLKNNNLDYEKNRDSMELNTFDDDSEKSEDYIKKYPPTFGSKRSNSNFAKVKKRDYFLCQKCGSPHSIEVHHIIPVCLGGDNSMKNLIALCEYCHDGVPTNPDEFPEYLSFPIKNGLQYYAIVRAYHVHLIDFLVDTTDLLDIDKKVYNFMDKYVIPAGNFNLNKCKSYSLWKKKKPE